MTPETSERVPVMDSPLPRSPRRFGSFGPVLQLTAVMLLLTSACAALPLLLQQDSLRPAFCDAPQGLQALLESSDFHTSSRTDVLDQIPFKQVTFERGPCYGECPHYRMVLYGNGQLELTGEAGVSHRGSVSRMTLVRVAQLLELAQAAATRRDYLAPWTDSVMIKIAVVSRSGDWRVSDIGEVAPVEVWALEQLLHGIYLSTEWAAQLPQP